MEGGPYFLSNNLFDASQCLPAGDYEFNIFDGLANSEVINQTVGEYNLYINGRVIKSGMDFGTLATTTFSIAIPTISMKPTKTFSPTSAKYRWAVFEEAESRSIARNSRIGEFPISIDYELSFTIIPKSTYNGWSSILSFTADPDSNNAKYGDRSPAFFFHHNSFQLRVTQGSTSHANNGFSSAIDTNPNSENYVKLILI